MNFRYGKTSPYNVQDDVDLGVGCAVTIVVIAALALVIANHLGLI